MTLDGNGQGALSGVKVLELGHVIAGPLAGTLMADMGAEVVHIEQPGSGDPLRASGPKKDGVPLWWKVSGRNKRSATLDLRIEDGREIARRLASWADVVITNFRIETLEKWHLDWEALHELNPKLIMLQITGFGAHTSRRNDPGFGKVGEARSGVAHLTGDPDGRPMFAGFSHGDSVTAVMGAMGVNAALYRKAMDPDFRGEWLDLSLVESLYRLIEWQVVIFDQLGIAPRRAGNRIEIAPAAIVDTYQAGDGTWLMVTSATLRSVQNIARLVGEPLDDYASPELQSANAERLDRALREWVQGRTASECESEMAAAGVVASPILSVADIMEDSTYDELGAIITVEDEELGPVRMQNVVPRLTNYPGKVWRAGPTLGADNDYVYRGLLGIGDDEYQTMMDAGTV